MNRFIDAACVTEENLFASAAAAENGFESDFSRGSKGSKGYRRGNSRRSSARNGGGGSGGGSGSSRSASRGRNKKGSGSRIGSRSRSGSGTNNMSKANANAIANANANTNANFGFAQEQIKHAYKEHSSIIESLRRELEASKTREKALVDEFSKKFQELHQRSPATFEALKTSASASASAASPSSDYHGNGHSKIEKMPFDDEEMPMDEMADTARMERTVRTMEHLEQKRIMDEFKRAADEELTQLREANKAQIRDIESELKSKVAEIDKWKKEAQNAIQERNFYRKQKEELEIFGSPVKSSSGNANGHGHGHGHNRNGYHGPLSSVVSPGQSSLDTNSTSSPVHSFTNMTTPDSDRSKSMNTNMVIDESPESYELAALENGEDISPILSRQNSKITPLQRLRASNITRKQNFSSRGSTPSTQMSPITTATDGSSNGSGGSGSSGGGGVNNERDNNVQTTPSATSRLTKLFDAMTTPNFVAFEKIARAIEISIDEKTKKSSSMGMGTRTMDDDFSKDDKENQVGGARRLPHPAEEVIELEEEEKKFVQNIKVVFDKSLNNHMDLIVSLKAELQETNMELQEGASKTSRMMKDLSDRNNQITELKNELQNANDSARNTHRLKEMLQMVADDQKANLMEFSSLRDKVKDIEQERDVLLQEKMEAQQESDKAIAAIQRVMADGASQHESVLEEYELKIKTLVTENALLKRKLDPSYDALGSGAATVTVKQSDWDSVNKDAKKCVKLEQEMVQVKNEVEEGKTRNEELEQALADMGGIKEEVRNLKEKLEDSKSIIKQLELQATAQFDDLEAENADMSALIDDMKDELKQKQDSHEKMLPEMIEQEKTISTLLSEKEKLEEKISILESEVAVFKEQSSATTEVLQTAKNVHAREQKLEDELSALRLLLENEMAAKAKLQKEFNSQKDHEVKLKSLRMQVIEMKEEKLTLKSRVKEVETLLERSNRIMSLMQETSDTEGTACQAILDLKDQLREEQELHHQLVQRCDKYGATIIGKLSQKVHSTLCLLETGVLGIAGESNATSLAMFDFSQDVSPKEQLLEKSLKIQRTENDRIRKNIAEIKSARDEESTALRTKLTNLQAKFQTQVGLLEKKDEEINELRDSLKESTTLGYISGDDSDEEEEEGMASRTNLDASVHVSRKSTDEEIAKMCQELQEAKEKAEREAMENAESLANAKMIISSIETSNKKMVSDLKSRLNDSNAAIVSLLDQAAKRDKDSARMKAEIERLRIEKSDIEMELELLSSDTPLVEEGAGASHNEVLGNETKEENKDATASAPSDVWK